jgi:hypothetical protein
MNGMCVKQMGITALVETCARVKMRRFAVTVSMRVSVRMGVRVDSDMIFASWFEMAASHHSKLRL